MIRWEYCTEHLACDFRRDRSGDAHAPSFDYQTDEHLHRLGSEGWELVSVVICGVDPIGFFKRPAKGTPDKDGAL